MFSEFLKRRLEFARISRLQDKKEHTLAGHTHFSGGSWILLFAEIRQGGTPAATQRR